MCVSKSGQAAREGGGEGVGELHITYSITVGLDEEGGLVKPILALFVVRHFFCCVRQETVG